MVRQGRSRREPGLRTIDDRHILPDPTGRIITLAGTNGEGQDVDVPRQVSVADQDETAAVAAELAESLGDIVYALRRRPGMQLEYVSPTIHRLTGYPAEVFYDDPGIVFRRILPGYEDRAALAFDAAGEDIREVTIPWLHRDGHTVWTHHRCRRVEQPDGSAVVHGAARDVTAQVEAEQALVRSRASYRLMAENASDVVWRKDLDDIVTWVSPSILTVLGRPPESVVGGRMSDHVHPDDAERLRLGTRRPDVGDSRSFEARYAHADGTYRWLHVTVRALADDADTLIGTVCSCRDVTAEVTARTAQARSERRFRLVMESAPIGMAVTELDGRLLEVNPALVRMLDRPPEELAGLRIVDLVAERDRSKIGELRAALLTEPGEHPDTTAVDVQVHRADGSPTRVQLALGLLRGDDDEPVSFVAQFVDMSRSYAAREALRFHASHDSLTGLLNRRELLSRLDRMLAHTRRRASHLAVLYADLDGLKETNDAHGHEAGDRLLVEAAVRIRAQLRDGDLVARLGGDEFVVVLPEIGDAADATAVAGKVVAAMCAPIDIGDVRLPAGVSVGLAVARDGDDAAALLRRADTALYRAKAAGGGTVRAYDDDR